MSQEADQAERVGGGHQQGLLGADLWLCVLAIDGQGHIHDGIQDQVVLSKGVIIGYAAVLSDEPDAVICPSHNLQLHHD